MLMTWGLYQKYHQKLMNKKTFLNVYFLLFVNYSRLHHQFLLSCLNYQGVQKSKYKPNAFLYNTNVDIRVIDEFELFPIFSECFINLTAKG